MLLAKLWISKDLAEIHLLEDNIRHSFAEATDKRKELFNGLKTSHLEAALHIRFHCPQTMGIFQTGVQQTESRLSSPYALPYIFLFFHQYLRNYDFELGMDEDDSNSQINIVDEWDEEPFLDFLRRTCLQRLALKAPISEAHLVECLKIMSLALRTLRVTSELAVIPMTSPFLTVNLSSGSFIGCASMVDYPFEPSKLMEFRCGTADDIPAKNKVVHLRVTRDTDSSFTFNICNKQSIDLWNN